MNRLFLILALLFSTQTIFAQELLILMSGLVIYEMMRGRYINIVLCKKLNQDDLDFLEPKEK